MFGPPPDKEFEEFRRSRLRKHAYAEFVSSIPYEDRLLEEADRREVVEGLARLIYEEYDRTGEFNVNHRHMAKAQAILSGEPSRSRVAPELDRRRAESIIKEAIDKGYIEEFILHEPWHFAVFLNENQPTTYPYQHSTTIAYTAQPKRIFFDSDAKDRLAGYREVEDHTDYPNPSSILDQGQIRLGNRHVSHTEGEGSQRQGVFFSDLSVIRQNYMHQLDSIGEETGMYSKRVVFEVQLPSNWLYMNVDRNFQSEEYHQDMESIKELDEKFGGPEGLKEYVLNNRVPGLEFVIASKPGLPIEYIRGVWDPEKSSEPVFVPLSNPEGLSYAKMIKKDFPDLVPASPEAVEEDLGGIETDYCSACGAELVWVMGDEKQVCPVCNPRLDPDRVGGKQVLSEELQQFEDVVQRLRQLLTDVENMEKRDRRVQSKIQSINTAIENPLKGLSGLRDLEPEKVISRLTSNARKYNSLREGVTAEIDSILETLGEQPENQEHRLIGFEDLERETERVREELEHLRREMKDGIKKLSTQFSKIGESEIEAEELYHEANQVEHFEDDLVVDLSRKLHLLPEFDLEKIEKEIDHFFAEIEEEMELLDAFNDIDDFCVYFHRHEKDLKENLDDRESFEEWRDYYNSRVREIAEHIEKFGVEVDNPELEDPDRLKEIVRINHEPTLTIHDMIEEVEKNAESLDEFLEQAEEVMGKIARHFSRIPLIKVTWQQVKRRTAA